MNGVPALRMQSEREADGSAVHSLRVTLADGSTGRRVHVHLAGGQGELSLQMRTADPDLRREILGDIPRLAQRLDEAGYRTAAGTESADTRHGGHGEESADPRDSPRRWPHGGEERGESGRRRARQPWMDEFESQGP